MFNDEYIEKGMQATTDVRIIHWFLVQSINYALLILYANLNLGLDHSSLNPLYIQEKTFIKYTRQANVSNEEKPSLYIINYQIIQ